MCQGDSGNDKKTHDAKADVAPASVAVPAEIVN